MVGRPSVLGCGFMASLLGDPVCLALCGSMIKQIHFGVTEKVAYLQAVSHEPAYLN